MDNYLSSRWPAGMAAPPAPEQKPAKKKKERKKRRVWRVILIILVAALLLGGLTAGAFFGVQYVADQLAAQQPPAESQTPSGGGKPDLPPVGENPAPSDSGEAAPAWSSDLLSRAEPDPSVQIELLSREGAEVLTPTEIYKKVAPSVVVVYAYNEEGYKVGSGVVISESGYIMTNYHVLQEGLVIIVEPILGDESGVLYEAKLVGYDEPLDLAVIKVEGLECVVPEYGSSDELEVGDAVYSIGNPMGYLQGAMSEGIVSLLGDRIDELDYEGRLIATSIALNSGNSGGALVDGYGRVVGITSAKVTGVRGTVVVEGLGLAIPICDARTYLNRILRTGNSARLSLGIQCYSGYELDGVTGILVAEASPNTPAYGLLLPNDLITNINGTRVYMVDDVTRILNELDPDDRVDITVIRDHREIVVNVGLYDRLPSLQ